jgi:plastocyanin
VRKMNKVLLAVVIVGAGLVVGWYAFGGSVSSLQQAELAPTPVVSVAPTQGSMQETGTGIGGAPLVGTEKGGAVARSVVTYSTQGFSPNVVTIKKGTIVAFMNDSISSMWVVTGVHPTHQLLPGFDQGKSVAKGGSYEYTFANVGTWKYHNEASPTQEGSVIVTE